MADAPQIFISHRHKDRQIADVVREWIQDVTSKQMPVYQTSQARGGASIGGNLNPELARELLAAEVVVLVFTAADDDWSYCMWECGVAFDPQDPKTRVVVLQCGSDAPKPLQHSVTVQATDLVSVSQFAGQFLTKEDFFPRYGAAITGLSQDDQKIRDCAKQLYDALQAVIPQQPDWKWPAWPRIELRMDLEDEEGLKRREDPEALALLLEKATVLGTDEFARQLFNMIDMKSMSLGEIFEQWKAANPESNSDWTSSLLNQMLEAGRGNFITPDWRLVENGRSKSWHIPMLLFFQRLPRDQRIQFDVYFPEFGTAGGGLRIPTQPTGGGKS